MRAHAHVLSLPHARVHTKRTLIHIELASLICLLWLYVNVERAKRQSLCIIIERKILYIYIIYAYRRCINRPIHEIYTICIQSM